VSPLPAKARRIRRPKSVSPERWAAWRTVHRTFDEGAYTDRAFDGEVERMNLDARQRSQCQHLAFGTVRAAKRLDHVIATVGKRPLTKVDAPVLSALRLGMFQLLESDGIADHAAVDQTVEIVRAATGERAVAFANAVMRRAQVDGAGILEKLDPTDPADAATLLSYPEWMVQRMVAAHGDAGREALAAQNEVGVGTPIRVMSPDVHVGDEPPQPWQALLPEARIVPGVSSEVVSLIQSGAVLPQSLASMAVAHIVDPQPGERILDMCAAPGGKTSHLSARMQGSGQIVACELHEHRADSMREMLNRLGAGDIVDVRCDDARNIGPPDGVFDRVLLDAPCTGLGVLGRRPDSRWKRTEDDLYELTLLQRELLVNAVDVLRPGGRLVYSTCTLLPEENEQQVEWALSELKLEPTTLGDMWQSIRHPHMPNCIQTWPQRDHTDGFFIAAFQKGG
jgi:16S rRNA (cytosine967-C5)-methyltransferase